MANDVYKNSVLSNSPPNVLELIGIRKAYGTVEVLHGVDFRVRSGSVHALLGANGAGKSTLMKIAVGATGATAGNICVNGADKRFSTPLEARKAGIGMVFQERSLVPELSVVDNIFLNSEPTRGRLICVAAELQECQLLFDRLGVDIPPKALVKNLSIADQQMVEVAKAIRLANSVLILDEPTAGLTETEVQRLFLVVRQIAASGTGIVYVSHRLGEVFALCDDITVIRDGWVALSTTVAATALSEIVDAIAGESAYQRLASRNDGRGRSGDASGPAPREAPSLLKIRGLEVSGKLHSISFDVRPREIVGVAGLAGSGRSTLLKALFGVVACSAGEIQLLSRKFRPTSPRAAIRRGVYLIPEDRKLEGLVLPHSTEANIVLSILGHLRIGLLIDSRRSAEVARDTITRLRIEPPDLRRPVEWLSGGNQQKVVLGKALNARSRVLLLDEPTFGVDVHSRAEIRSRVRAFVEAGNAAIWATSDLEELRQVSDRILILADGMVREVVSNWPEPLTEGEITHLMQPRSIRQPAAPGQSTDRPERSEARQGHS